MSDVDDAVVGSSHPNLIERDQELDHLRGLITAATAAGTGSLATVLGAPGIGKTALLVALAAEAEGVRALSARAGELEREFPYAVIRQLLDPILRSATAEEREELLSGPAAPAGALILGDGATPPADVATLDYALYWLIASLADSRALLLCVDDGHWCDPASLRLLIYLSRRLSDLPAALVVASRPGELGRERTLHERLRAEAHATIELRRLSEPAVGSLVRRHLPDADRTFAAACAAATGGNPFMLSELILAIQAARIEPIAASAPRLRSIGSPAVMRSVLLRLATLPPEAAILARALAVLGDHARPDLLRRLGSVEEQAAGRALDGLRELEILAAEARPSFVHSIVRAAVYEDIPPAERSRLHAAAARLLHGEQAPPDAVAAQLLATEPGADPWVVEQLTAAASSALVRSAPETTAAYLERALEESVPGIDQGPLLFMLGGARFQTADGGAVEPLERALDLANTPRAQMEAARGLASAHMTELDADKCWAVAEHWVDVLSEHREVADELELFLPQRLFGDIPDPQHELERVASWTPDPTGRTPLDRSMLAVKGWAATITAERAEVAAAMASAALSSGTLVIDDTWYITFEMAAWALLSAGRHEETREHLDAALESLRGIGRMLRSASLLPIRSELHRRCGRLALAEEDARIALEIIPPGQIYEPYAAGVMALVLIDEGRLEDARQVLEQRGGPSPGTTQVATLARGRLRIAEGDLTRGAAQIVAYGEASHALRDGSPGYWPWRSTVATALARAGQSEEAVELAARELSVAEQVGRDDLRGAPLRALGIATGGDRGIDLLEQAVEVLAGSELALEHLGALLDLGIALRLAGQRSRARAPLRQALDEASRIGAGAIADRAREELLASGARPRRTALVGFEALTPSERRVASLAAQGLTNRQIAQALYVTVKTVEVHLRNSYDKLQITGKRELAAALPDNAVESVAQTA